MKILPFVTQSHLALPNLKNIQMGNVIRGYPNNS